MQMYLNDPDYGYAQDKPQICFTFEIIKQSDARFEVHLHYND
jgi:hypothetical protein